MWAVVAFGIICRLAQFLSNQSFWGDEAYVVLNVRDKTPTELVGSLTMKVRGLEVPPQSAGPLYLISLKYLSQTIGDNEYAYRLPALVMGCALLPLLAWLGLRMLSPTAALVVVAWAALCDRMIDSSALVKQYGGDMTVAVALMLIATAEKICPVRRLAVVSVLTAVLMWFSEPAVFVFAGIALALGAEVFRLRGRMRGAIAWTVVVAPAALSFVILYSVSMRAQQSRELYDFWKDYFPDYHRPLSLPWWLLRSVYGLCDYAYRPMGAIFLLLAGLGIWKWSRDEKLSRVSVFVAPVLLTLVAAAAHAYPFGQTRVDFFLIPGILILAGAGLDSLGKPQWLWLAAAPMLASGLWQAVYHLPFPRCTSHIRPAVEWVKEHRQSDDAILLIGQNSWLVFYTYWPDVEGDVRNVGDAQTAEVSGRFWCVCEFAPGEFNKKRRPVIDLVSLGARHWKDLDYMGRGGAAMLFER